MTPVNRFSNWFKTSDKKKVIEFISAAMSIPVLTTVFLLNLSNLRKLNSPASPASTPTPQIVTSKTPVESLKDATNSTRTVQTATPTKFACKKEIGPVEIVSPQDDQLISQDPVNIEISYDRSEYCPLVWAYRLDSNQWSDYTDKAISLYNLPSGDKNLEVKIKSVSGNQEVVLLKRFSYINPKSTPAVSITPSSSSSATPKVQN